MKWHVLRLIAGEFVKMNAKPSHIQRDVLYSIFRTPLLMTLIHLQSAGTLELILEKSPFAPSCRLLLLSVRRPLLENIYIKYNSYLYFTKELRLLPSSKVREKLSPAMTVPHR